MKRLEKQISKTKIFLDYKNLYNFLRILRNFFPAWCPKEFLVKRLPIVYGEELDYLVRERLLDKKEGEENEGSIKKYGRFFPTYRISKNGIEFLNGLETHKLNNRIFVLTIIMTILGIFQVALGLINIWFSNFLARH